MMERVGVAFAVYIHNIMLTVPYSYRQAWPRVYTTFVQLNMKFFMLINLKLLTIANSLLLNISEH